MSAGAHEAVAAYGIDTEGQGSEPILCVVEDVDPRRAVVRMHAGQTVFVAGQEALFQWTNPETGERMVLPVCVGYGERYGDFEVLELHFADQNEIPAKGGLRTPVAGRRRANRAEPAAGEEVQVSLQAHDSARGKPVATKLLDISATGLALELRVGTEPPQPVSLVQVNVTLPGEPDPLCLTARLRHRTRESKTTIRYGLEFEPSGRADYEVQLGRIVAWVSGRE